MTPATLSRIGTALYGPSWKRAMGAALGMSERGFANWVSGATPIPPGRVPDIAALVAAHAATLAALSEELQRAASMHRFIAELPPRAGVETISGSILPTLVTYGAEPLDAVAFPTRDAVRAYLQDGGLVSLVEPEEGAPYLRYDEVSRMHPRMGAWVMFGKADALAAIEATKRAAKVVKTL